MDNVKRFWQEIYVAHIRAGLGRSNARDAADDAVKEFMATERRPWNVPTLPAPVPGGEKK